MTVNKTMLELAVPLRGRFEHDPSANERVPQPSAGQASPTHHPRHVLSCKMHAFVHPLSRTNAFRARLPSNSNCSSFENEAFVRDFLQVLNVEDVKTKLSCETSFNFWTLKMWKRNFRARLPSNSNRSSFENEAFVRHFTQIPSVQALKTKTLRHSNFQTSRLSDIQTFRHSDIQTLRHSNFQTSDFHTFRLSGFQTSRLWDSQTFRQSFHHSLKIRNSDVSLSNFLRLWLYHAILYTVFYWNILLYYITLYYTIVNNIVKYYMILYCILLYYINHTYYVIF